MSAIIVAYGSPDLLLRAIEHCIQSGAGETIVWDNSSDNQVETAVQGSTFKVEYHRSKVNVGFGGGINEAVRYANGEFVLFVNPDCLINPEALNLMRQRIESAGTGIVAPRMQYPSGEFGIAGGPFPTAAKELAAMTRLDDILPKSLRRSILSIRSRRGTGGTYADSLQPGGNIAVDWVSGFCMMMRRSIFRTVGGFDENYFLYFEDVDICRRAREMGYSVEIVRDATVIHYESTTTNRSRKSSHYKDGLRVFVRKHGTAIDKFLVAVSIGAR